MNVNFGLFPPIEIPATRGKERTRVRKRVMAERALQDLDVWLEETRL